MTESFYGDTFFWIEELGPEHIVKLAYGPYLDHMQATIMLLDHITNLLPGRNWQIAERIMINGKWTLIRVCSKEIS